jgi:hypothetical protein
MKQKFDSITFHENTQINRADLEAALASNPANLAYYIEQAALWSSTADQIKMQRDIRGSEIYVDMKADKVNKPTDGLITATQKLDKEYQNFENQLRLAREQLALYEGAVTALEKKQFSLGSLSANSRTEYDTTTSAIPMGRSTAEEKADRRARVLAAQG